MKDSPENREGKRIMETLIGYMQSERYTESNMNQEEREAFESLLLEVEEKLKVQGVLNTRKETTIILWNVEGKEERATIHSSKEKAKNSIDQFFKQEKDGAKGWDFNGAEYPVWYEKWENGESCILASEATYEN
jgi:hypothetical protein